MGAIYKLSDALSIGRRCPFCGTEWTIEALFSAESYSSNGDSVRNMIERKKADFLASDAIDYGGLCPACERFNPALEQKHFAKGYRAWLQTWVNLYRPRFYRWMYGFYAILFVGIFVLWLMSAPGSGKFFMPRTLGCIALAAFFAVTLLILYILVRIRVREWQRNHKRIVSLDDRKAAQFIKIVYRNAPALLPRRASTGVFGNHVGTNVASMQSLKRIIYEYLWGFQFGHCKKMRKFLDATLSQI